MTRIVLNAMAETSLLDHLHIVFSSFFETGGFEIQSLAIKFLICCWLGLDIGYGQINFVVCSYPVLGRKS